MAKGNKHVDLNSSPLYALRQLLGLTPANGDTTLITDPVFICIDCEAFEHAHHKITEIAVAILDTKDLAGNTPDATQWISKIKYAHFKPIEYGLLKNKNFVKGCPEAFNFGTSTWIKLADAKVVLQNIFKDPSRLHDAADFKTSFTHTGRDIIFLGHNASSDTSFLKQVGFNLVTDGGIKSTMDTQKLAGGTKKRSVALQRLLLSLNVDPYNLHNAGNDAAYTLQAMLLMALKDQSSPGSVASDLLNHAGKLPPAKYNSVVAPHIFAGTAVGCTVEAAAEGANSARTTKPNIREMFERQEQKNHERAILNTSSMPRDTRTISPRIVERQERKHAARAARNASGLSTTGAMASQKPLSFSGSHTIFKDSAG